MMSAQYRLMRCQRGVVLVWAAMMMVVLLGCCALAVDVGYLYVTRAELQNAADAGALAAIGAIRDGQTKTQAQQEAVLVAQSNNAAAKNVALNPDQDVAFGSYNFAAKRFEPGGYFADATAARVTARRTAGSPAGPVPLFFANVLGRHIADVSATGIAAVGKREVVIMQDCSRSFTEEIEDAKAADRALVLAMQEQSLAGDHVGVVSFVDKAKRELDRTLIPDGTATILTAIGGIRATTVVGLGTNIAPGFEEARQILRRADEKAQTVIVLVSDGMPEPASRRQPAIAGANNCARDGISIFTVTLTQEEGGQYGLGGADAEFNAGLVRGYGRAYQTPNSEDLVAILTTIARQMPVRLVE
jgi:Flp pilus assembly protein TadG